MKKTRLLLISFYFRPDLSAGSFRTTALVNALVELNDPTLEIDIITTLPNRYISFSADACELEKCGSVTIHRIKLPAHKSGMLDQAKAFFYFAKSALSISKKLSYDLVFATSSRLMTAFLGSLISSRSSVPLYLDIRDIFVETLNDVLPRKLTIFLAPLFSLVERLSFKKATHINIVSPGFECYFKKKYPSQPLSCFTNGIDDSFLDCSGMYGIDNSSNYNQLTILYAGNIGESQGLHLIIPHLAKLLEKKVRFKIFGDGGRKVRLEAAIAEHDVINVELHPPISRSALINEYINADVLFLHLNDYDAFKKVLPSKIFEYAALGKPIWAGVGGYAAEFLISEVSNAAVFPPCNAHQAINEFFKLNINSLPRDGFVKKYSRKTIMKSMAVDILSVINLRKRS